MQKGFGDSLKKKSLKDYKYLRFHNDEKIANNLLRNKKPSSAKKIYIKLLNDGYQNFDILFNLGFIELSQKKYKDALNYLTKAKLLSKKINIDEIDSICESKPNRRSVLQVIKLTKCRNTSPGKLYKSNGEYVLNNLNYAIKETIKDKKTALVTGPLSKENVISIN